MKLLIFLLTLFFLGKSYAQDTDLIRFDSKKIYTQKFMDSLIGQLKVAKRKMIEPLDIKKMLESDNKLEGWTYYYFGKAVVSYQQKKYDSALVYADIGIKKFENSIMKRDFDIQNVMLIYLYKGLTYIEIKDYKKAITQYQMALDINSKYPYKFSGTFVSGIADSHYALGNDSLALKYYSKVLIDTAFMSYPRVEVITNKNMGNLYNTFKQRDKSLAHYRKAIYVSKNSDYKGDLGTLYNYMGTLFYNEGNMDSTLYYYQKALQVNKTYGLGESNLADVEDLFMKIFLEVHKENDLSNAGGNLKVIIDKVLSTGKISKNDRLFLKSSIELLGLVYQKQKNTTEYVNLLKQSFDIMNDFHEGQLNENLQNIETEYQTKEKDASIAQLEENKAQQEKIINQQKTIAFSLGGLLLLLSGLGYLFWKQRKLKNQYEKENLEQRLLRSQMNPHFVSNALNTVCALVDKKSDQTIPYVNKLAGLFRLTLNNSREEFIGLDEEITALKNYLELQSNLSNDFDFNINVDNDIDIEEVIVPPMLMQPFVENAIIHGISGGKDRGKVEIRISKDKSEGLLQCHIIDNGIGYGNASVELKKHKSVSGDIVGERLAILKKKFKVNTRFNIINRESVGTRVELFLPYLLN